MLCCERLTVAVDDHCLVDELSFAVEPGEAVCILGPNGVGKTLTLHTIAGLRAPASGTVYVKDRAIGEIPGRELACQLGLLLQTYQDPFPSTVFETALLGRHPHIGFWQWESVEDREIARQALDKVDLSGLEHRDVNSLSGGEHRRLAIATLLTQDPDICLLDEPLNHLDPQHQADVLEIFVALAGRGKCVISSLHDPNMAGRYFDRVLLLFGEGEWLFGPVDSVLTDVNLSRLYRTRFQGISWKGRQVFFAD